MGLNINREEIFNSSSKKVLINEYENLKKDYSKINAIRYKTFYENEPLSFILDNSRYIFSESFKGYDFYKNIIENSIIPFNRLDDEYYKVYEYTTSSINKMGENQSKMYTDLLDILESKRDDVKHSINLYTNIMENVSDVDKYYDMMYEYNKNHDVNILNNIFSLLTESDSLNLMDAINLGININEASSSLCKYLRNAFYENPDNSYQFKLNSYTENVISRMMKDKYFSESVNLNKNTTLRTLITGISNIDESDILSSITENTNPAVIIDYISPNEAVNRIYEDTLSDFLNKEDNDIEKYVRLTCEKAIIETNLSFALIDEMYSNDEDKADRNSIVEKFSIDSGNYINIPNTITEHINIFEKRLDEINEELSILNERYFSKDLGPNPVIAKSMGYIGSDNYKFKDSKNDDELEKAHYKSEYEPKVYNNEDDDEDDEDFEKSQAAKNRQTDKYSNVDLDSDEFKGILEKEESEYEEIEKPKDPSLSRKIQNKAMENNFRFKRKLAQGKRNFQNVKNAGKAVAKIPNNINTQIKKQIEEWDEADDNKRKEYMLKPGVRKKYYRALKLAILHGSAFAINPLLLIITGICQYVSTSKDVRIRNELIRELKAEMKVCDEKIEDARANGDNKQKYKLVRLREKLEGEYNRVTINSKTI